MSILLTGQLTSRRWRDVTDACIGRLLGSGDQVRVLVADVTASDHIRSWQSKGVHMATGDPSNGDLIERAAQGCRSIVVFDPNEEILAKALEAQRFARVERLIVCSSEARRRDRTELPGDLIWISGHPRSRWRGGTDSNDFAMAIEAADDVRGPVRLEIDLGDPRGWSQLGLSAP